MGFAEDFAKICERAGDRVDAVVRSAVLGLGASIVQKSPVGNPDLWQGPAPEGYSGGRFKGNWQYGQGAINTSTSSAIDASGESSIGRIQQGLENWKPGQRIYITNSLPYAKRLEYDAWSQQAPGGMVRLSVQAFAQNIAQAARGIK